MAEPSWDVGGSQERVVHEIILPEEAVVATAETDLGLALRGAAALVHELSRALQRA